MVTRVERIATVSVQFGGRFERRLPVRSAPMALNPLFPMRPAFRSASDRGVARRQSSTSHSIRAVLPATTSGGANAVEEFLNGVPEVDADLGKRPGGLQHLA